MLGELHLRILAYNNLTIDECWRSADNYDSYWRMYINNCDGASLILPDEKMALKKDGVYFIPAWVRFSCHNTRPIQHFCIHFDILNLSDIVIREIFNRPFHVKNSPIRFKTVTENFPNGCKFNPAELCLIKSILYAEFHRLLAGEPKENIHRIARSIDIENRFTFILQHIETHLADDLSVPLLARLSHMSSGHFAHSFKDHIGQSPARYILERRIASAATRLIFSHDSIDRIAESVGFTNRFHFSRNFKMIMGVTPAGYRKNARV
ncbi:MAG: helix-turn-helix transcriptional regulator [Phycisphaerae bacterium]|jgi:AraC-like DNA-binding protein|nr:helix-turn-helix transcriptional regulator [Phycisphaerae bacterium]